MSDKEMSQQLIAPMFVGIAIFILLAPYLQFNWDWAIKAGLYGSFVILLIVFFVALPFVLLTNRIKNGRWL